MIFLLVGEDASRHEAAAVKIQSNYRGYVARKEVDALKSSQGGVKMENEGRSIFNH